MCFILRGSVDHDQSKEASKKQQRNEKVDGARCGEGGRGCDLQKLFITGITELFVGID